MTALAEHLARRWPDARCELDHTNAFELLCATILAAQSTDKMINTITPALFARWPDARALAAADPAELERVIHSSGFFRAKARSLLGMARALVERHGGEVPADMEALCALPGVARKTANVILGTVFRQDAGVVVDTHVTRLSQRLGLTRETDPVKIERDLMALLPRERWRPFADQLIWHGRRICFARQPACGQCDLAPLCPSADTPGRDAEPAAATRTTARTTNARTMVTTKKPAPRSAPPPMSSPTPDAMPDAEGGPPHPPTPEAAPLRKKAAAMKPKAVARSKQTAKTSRPTPSVTRKKTATPTRKERTGSRKKKR